jgi:hypothetical protein
MSITTAIITLTTEAARQRQVRQRDDNAQAARREKIFR